MATITLENLRHSYLAHPAADADWALKQLDVEWEDGGAYALLGPSGCGKTTLLNIISGLLRPSQGRVLFDGQDVTDLPPDQRHIAQVFQFPVIYDTMTVYDNLAFPLRNRGVAEADVDARVRQIAELLELTATLKNRASGLTADSKQKISLGRGLVRSDVNVIMFDEPLTVIDPHLKWVLRSKLKELHQRADAHDDLRHPRPDRGADDRRPGGGHGSGRGRADRHAGGAVRGAQAHLRRPLHRLAGHERFAVRARQRPADARRPAGRDRQWRHGAREGGLLEIGVRPEFISFADARPRRRVVKVRMPGAIASSTRGSAGRASSCWSTKAPTCRRVAAHLRFDPARTRVYRDGWVVE